MSENNNGKPKNNNNNNKKHPFVQIKRRIRLTYLRILRIDDPPERISRGIAIGVLMGILPTFGLGGLMSFGIAFILKANKAAAILGSFIMNPLTSPFFWTLSIVLGSVIMREDSSTIMAKFHGENFWKGAGRTYLVFLVGNILVSAVFTAASYYISKKWIISHRKHKAAKKLEKLRLERHPH